MEGPYLTLLTYVMLPTVIRYTVRILSDVRLGAGFGSSPSTYYPQEKVRQNMVCSRQRCARSCHANSMSKSILATSATKSRYTFVSPMVRENLTLVRSVTANASPVPNHTGPQSPRIEWPLLSRKTSKASLLLDPDPSQFATAGCRAESLSPL